jgi:Glu-tRNA(Gln) amidotransferase subunit E-like FAD-binding protein
MSKTYTVPISSLKPWRGPKAQRTQSTPVTPQPPQSPESPDTQVLQRLKEISCTLKSLPYRHEINDKYLQQLPIPDATYISTDIPITTLQNMWTSGKSRETPEQTAAVERAMREMLENENMSDEEKELLMTIMRPQA